MRYMLVFQFAFFLTSASFSQKLRLVKSLKIQTPTEVSIDRAGNIYFATFHGDIIRYNQTLENEQIFSPPNPGNTNILEAWQGLRIFTFHRDLQVYRLINRNLSLNEDYSFPTGLVGFAEIATPTFDNNIWVFDQTDFSLKKYQIFSSRLSSITQMDLLLNKDDYEILYCKEYQNRLFMSTKNSGILIFDSFGNYIKTYPDNAITFFNFWDDFLYFIKNGQLVKINLYNEEIVRTDLPDDDIWMFALIFEGNEYLFSEKQLNIYHQ